MPAIATPRAAPHLDGPFPPAGTESQNVRYGSEKHFVGRFRPKKLLAQPSKPVKPYDFPIEHASDMSMRLIFAISGHISIPESYSSLQPDELKYERPD
jgi:hypothetical protein